MKYDVFHGLGEKIERLKEIHNQWRCSSVSMLPSILHLKYLTMGDAYRLVCRLAFSVTTPCPTHCCGLWRTSYK